MGGAVRLQIYGVCALAGLIAGCAAYSGPIVSTPDSPALRPLVGLHSFYFLPETLLTINVAPAPDAGAKSPGGSVERITFGSKIGPDQHAPRLLYEFEPSSMADDILQVDTTEEGLLKQVATTTTDRTGDIIVAGAQLLFTVLTGGASPPPEAAGLQSTCSKEPLAAAFSPYNEDGQLQEVYEALLKRCYRLVISASGPCGRGGDPKFLSGPCAALPYQTYASFASRYPGIYFRRIRQIVVTIYKLDSPENPEGEMLWTGPVSIFDKSDLYQVSIDRASFVKQQTTIVFTNGSLTSISLNKPSQVLAAVNIPVKVARIVFAIPLAGLQQQSTMLNAQATLLTAQANLMNAQSTLLKLKLAQRGKSIVATPPAQ